MVGSLIRRAALGTLALAVAVPADAQRRAPLRAAVGIAPAPTTLLKTRTLGSDPQLPHRRSESARLGLEFLAASAGAVAGGIAGYAILRDVSDRRVKGDEGYTRSGNVGWLVGSFAGSAVGAQLAGTRMGGKSPIWATALGALVGTVPLGALGVDEPYLPLVGFALGWIPQAALAAGGFTMGEPR